MGHCVAIPTAQTPLCKQKAAIELAGIYSKKFIGTGGIALLIKILALKTQGHECDPWDDVLKRSRVWWHRLVFPVMGIEKTGILGFA